MDFVHLHCHSHRSLLDGLCSPEDLVIAAKEKGQKALAITDHGSISGLISLYKAAKEHGVKPIFGIEAYFVDDVAETKSQKSYHIVLLAKSDRGLKSLFKLMSRGHDYFYYKPRIDMSLLYDTEDIIASTACLGGLLSHPNYERVVTTLHDFFEDDLYLELMPVNVDLQCEVNQRAIQLSRQYDIKLIATNDVHYLKKEDQRLHNFLLKMHTGGKMEFEVEGLFLRDYDQMLSAFSKMQQPVDRAIVEEALANTLEVADKCNAEMPESNIVLPQMTEEDPSEVLWGILEERVDTVYPKGFDHLSRLDYEFQVIKDRGFIDYFLLVYDLVEWARSQHMQLGCGRGSAGGSLICYILGITDVDPIKNGLLFERFLNPERTDYPDIDLDFPRSRRQEVIDYLRRKYGDERVSYISTVAKLKAKSAFKDVARQLGVSFPVANQLSEALDDERTFSETVKENPLFSQTLSEELLEEITYYVEGISGTMRHTSKHAAGIVIAPSRIDDFGILEKSKEDRCINWDMNDVSHQGLVKIDVLGLRTLDVMNEALRLIKKRHNIQIDWRDVEFNDPEILNEFGFGNTIGIFQFEQTSTRRLVKRLKPIINKGILVDCNALVRPGPLDSGMTEKYIGRHTGKDVSYNEPYIDWFVEHGIAADTQRVVIYQEQVIEVLRVIAGYTIPQADVIRRIFAKKKGDIDEHRAAFLKGCKKTVKMPAEIANVLFDNLETFSRYGFNKSHAAAYTELGLRQMYLKINFPLEYMTALFRWPPDDKDKKKRLLQFTDECKRLDIEVTNPDINLSKKSFSIEDGKILIGLEAVKGVGEKGLEHIEKQRQSKPFKSLVDFRLRIPKSKVNKRVLKHLILSGCFDSMGVNHKFWSNVLDTMSDKEDLHTIKIPEEMGIDFPEDVKEMNKAALLGGVYRMDIEPELGLEIDTDELEDTRNIIGECQECGLREYYKCPVAMEYAETSQIMIIVEAPGEDEVRLGRPLIGKVGRKLMSLLAEIGVERDDVYLSNVYKCRPLDNKLPPNTPKECYDILLSEIETLRPKFILALGNRSREFFSGEKTGIQAAADKLECEVEIVNNQPIPVLYSVHPSSLFYENGKENEERLRNSLQVLKEIIERG